MTETFETMFSSLITRVVNCISTSPRVSDHSGSRRNTTNFSKLNRFNPRLNDKGLVSQGRLLPLRDTNTNTVSVTRTMFSSRDQHWPIRDCKGPFHKIGGGEAGRYDWCRSVHTTVRHLHVMVSAERGLRVASCGSASRPLRCSSEGDGSRPGVHRLRVDARRGPTN
ncbi:hypothetical protein BO86DRAFT_172468 [Aspergillus japonicus CBS 114.51]|uniref:Uncharacterized protein n=1 Tax=Aspergillus japonicus CBS 114.51 TaxID=1448312 RepID=A0A8T8WTL7_ASPJA|nr:hypothetical protein BO86DRAFT_172468 [Aspergillus japonicus CBS 114.51]RAH78994.1 hypothetical protein BO86DRAFT_172468 [Aspergillus japonicus CBS 114.51]